MPLSPDILVQIDAQKRELLLNAEAKGLVMGYAKAEKDGATNYSPVAYFRDTIGTPDQGELPADQIIRYDPITQKFTPELSSISPFQPELSLELMAAINAYWAILLEY